VFNHRARSLSSILPAVLMFAFLAAPSATRAAEAISGSARVAPPPNMASLIAIPQSLAPVFSDAPRLLATSENQVALRPRNASTGLSLVGTVSAVVGSGTWRIRADSITNTRSGGTSGTLRVVLWATSTVPVFGNTINAYTLGSFALNPLAGGFHYSNVDQTVTAIAPPSGCYYLTVALEEFQSGSYPYVDLVTFTVGGTPGAGGYSQFAFGSGSCQVTAQPCVQNATTACLLSGRFKATVRYRNGFDNQSANADASLKSVTGFASASFETVFFYFNSSNNIEIMLKMLDQGNTNGQGQPTIAVLFGSASPLRTELTITDTTNGAVRTYTSTFNSGQGGTDFTAFVK
jgi:hypothetical protein